MSEMKMVTVQIAQPPAPEGFEHTDEFREPKDCEWFLSSDGSAVSSVHYWIGICRWILRKLPATPKEPTLMERADALANLRGMGNGWPGLLDDLLLLVRSIAEELEKR